VSRRTTSFRRANSAYFSFTRRFSSSCARCICSSVRKYLTWSACACVCARVRTMQSAPHL
jgi:hypothetical protein